MIRWKHGLTLLLGSALALSLGACGMIGEKAAAPRVARLTTALTSCSYPQGSELIDPEQVSVAMITQGVDCLRSQMDSAFRDVHGQVSGELSVDEIRELTRRGILTLDFLKSADEETWDGLGGVLSLFNPDGRPALSRKAIARFMHWVREYSDVYVRIMKLAGQPGHLSLFGWEVAEHAINAVDDFSKLLSDRGRMTLRQAQALVRSVFQDNPGVEKSTLAQLDAAWKLKALVLEDHQGRGIEGPLEGAALKGLIAPIVQGLRRSETSYTWIQNLFRPQFIPAGISSNAEQVVSPLIEYFRNGSFATIDVDSLRGIVRALSPDSGLADLSPDLVRISQRLAPPSQRHEGLNAAAFPALLEQFPKVTADLLGSSQAFVNCPSIDDCDVRVGDVYLSNPELRRVATQGSFNFYALDPASSASPLETPLAWGTVIQRFTSLELISRVFQTFDSDGDGKIPYLGTDSSEIRDASALAFTFLRFISAGNLAHGDPGAVEQAVARPVLIKPDSLYHLVGLIGDRSMVNGDGDGTLNADEFFGVQQIYQLVDQLSGYATSYVYPPYLLSPPEWSVGNSGVIYSRKDFVRQIAEGFKNDAPGIYRAFNELPDDHGVSLMHSLISVPDEPKDVYTYEGEKIRLQQYAKPEAALAPSAIFVFLQRTMLRCDADQDWRLSWHELDCAMPLLMEAAEQTVSSELVDLDPGVHDGAKFLLKFLQSKGAPATVAKLIAINGSIKSVRLSGDLIEDLSNSAAATWEQVAAFTSNNYEHASSGARAIYRAQAIRRYGQCDSDRDGILSGREMECVVDRAFAELEDFIARAQSSAADAAISSSALQIIRSMEEAPVVRAGIKLAIEGDQEAGRLIERFAAGRPAVSSDVSKILNIFEESLRRKVPLCQLHDC
jgi:hypothetical protein